MAKKPLTMRPIGRACFCGADRVPGLEGFLMQEFGEIPATIKAEDIPRLEKWYLSKGNSLPVKGPLAILIHQIEKFKMVQVGYFDVV